MNKRDLIFLARLITVLLGISAMSVLISGELSAKGEDKSIPPTIEKTFKYGSKIRIRFLTDKIMRIQIAGQGKEFKGSALNRYGFIENIETNPKIKLSESKNSFSAQSPFFRLKGDCRTGEIIITKSSDGTVLLDQKNFSFDKRFSIVSFHASKDEDWVGFGDQTRDRLYHRGYIADCYVRNVVSYLPVPFFISTKGVGVMVNTTYRTIFDMCKSDPDNYFWKDYSDNIDYYVMVDNDFKGVIDLYTTLTGKPKLPPEWSFGPWYICRMQANDFEVVSDALNFRREGISCDVIGLEPGWMEKFYDYSTEKTWSKERFPIPSYNFNGPYNFINALQRMGFKLELWICNDYDLSYEEERRIKRQPSNSSDDHFTNSNETFEVDEHLTDEVYCDKITKKDEPWFAHLEKFVDQGVSFFKQDGSNQVLDHPDRLWGNGMLDNEMHNLYPLLWSRQMYEGFKEHTGKRPLIFTDGGWTGFQAWSGTWTGDTGGRLQTLGALLNTSLIGHSWATTDMEVTQKEGIHYGYLQPWSEIDSWNYFRMPWLQGEELLEMFKYYSRFRESLIPYLYTWAYHATQTGCPLLRPLTLEFPKDKNCRENLHQYLLGRDLMVGIYERKIYFPEGTWKDFWTGKVHEGNQTEEITWPDNRGGALFIRSGAIIPFGPEMKYWGEKPLNEMRLYIFPDEKESHFDLYEDDGVSLKNLDGEYAITPFSAIAKSNSTIVKIGGAKGSFKGQVKTRTWDITLHEEKPPVSVTNNEKLLAGEHYSWDERRQELLIKGIKAPAVIKVEF